MLNDAPKVPTAVSQLVHSNCHHIYVRASDPVALLEDLRGQPRFQREYISTLESYLNRVECFEDLKAGERVCPRTCEAVHELYVAIECREEIDDALAARLLMLTPRMRANPWALQLVLVGTLAARAVIPRFVRHLFTPVDIADALPHDNACYVPRPLPLRLHEAKLYAAELLDYIEVDNSRQELAEWIEGMTWIEAHDAYMLAVGLSERKVPEGRKYPCQKLNRKVFDDYRIRWTAVP